MKVGLRRKDVRFRAADFLLIHSGERLLAKDERCCGCILALKDEGLEFRVSVYRVEDLTIFDLGPRVPTGVHLDEQSKDRLLLVI